MTDDAPISGQIWRHWKGTAYRVLGMALDAETTEPVVLYRDAENELAPIWARPLTEWHHQVTASKRRFERLIAPPRADDGEVTITRARYEVYKITEARAEVLDHMQEVAKAAGFDSLTDAITRACKAETELRRLWTLIDGHDPDNPDDGPRCRDCADNFGICENTGLPCDPQKAAEEKVKRLHARLRGGPNG